MIKRNRCRDTQRCCQGVKDRSSGWGPTCGLHPLAWQGIVQQCPERKGQRLSIPREQGPFYGLQANHCRAVEHMTAPFGAVSVAMAFLTCGTIKTGIRCDRDDIRLCPVNQHPTGDVAIVGHLADGQLVRTEVLPAARKPMDGMVYPSHFPQSERRTFWAEVPASALDGPIRISS